MESSTQGAVSYATGVLFRFVDTTNFVDVNLFNAVLGPIILTQFLFIKSTMIYQYEEVFQFIGADSSICDHL